MVSGFAGFPIGVGRPVFIVAEMAWSHDGAPELAEFIIRGASQAGADAINFHLTCLQEYMVRSYGAGSGRVSAGHETPSIYEYLDSVNLEFDEWAQLADLAKELGLRVSTMCNDRVSLDFADATINPDLLMIHPSALADERFVRSVARRMRPVVLYIGGSYLGEVERAIEWVRSEGNKEIILQHGFQSYPTRVEDANLAFIPTLRELFGFPVAYGDHTDAETELALVLPLLAVAMGAQVIEKHITHDRAKRGEDFESALNPDEFSVLVDRIRRTEQALGDGTWEPLGERELHYREVSRKRAVAARDIEKGESIGVGDISFKRSDTGLAAEELQIVLDRRTRRHLAADEPITADAVE